MNFRQIFKRIKLAEERVGLTPKAPLKFLFFEVDAAGNRIDPRTGDRITDEEWRRTRLHICSGPEAEGGDGNLIEVNLEKRLLAEGESILPGLPPPVDPPPPDRADPSPKTIDAADMFEAGRIDRVGKL